MFYLFSETSRYGSNKPEETKLSSLAYSNASCEFFTRNSLIHGCPQNKWPGIAQIQLKASVYNLLINEGFLCED